MRKSVILFISLLFLTISLASAGPLFEGSVWDGWLTKDTSPVHDTTPISLVENSITFFSSLFSTFSGKATTSNSCQTNQECVQKFGYRAPFCNANKICTQNCQTNSECTQQYGTQRPFCSNSLCTFEKKCTLNKDCEGTTKPICDNTGMCANKPLQCIKNSDCSRGNFNLCDNNRCVATKYCASDSACEDSTKPYCRNNQCSTTTTPPAECSENTDCIRKFGQTRPYCAYQYCVTDKICLNSNECVGTQTPYCNGGHCSKIQPPPTYINTNTCSTNNGCTDLNKPYCDPNNQCATAKTCTTSEECTGADGLGFCTPSSTCTRTGAQIRLQNRNGPTFGNYTFLFGYQSSNDLKQGRILGGQDTLIPIPTTLPWASLYLHPGNSGCASAMIDYIFSPWESPSPQYIKLKHINGKEMVIDVNSYLCQPPASVYITFPALSSSTWQSDISYFNIGVYNYNFSTDSSDYRLHLYYYAPLISTTRNIPLYFTVPTARFRLDPASSYRAFISTHKNNPDLNLPGYCDGYVDKQFNVTLGQSVNITLDACLTNRNSTSQLQRETLLQEDLPVNTMGEVLINSSTPYATIFMKYPRRRYAEGNRTNSTGSARLPYINTSLEDVFMFRNHNLTLISPPYWTFIGSSVQYSPSLYQNVSASFPLRPMTTYTLNLTAQKNPQSLLGTDAAQLMPVTIIGSLDRKSESAAYINNNLVLYVGNKYNDPERSRRTFYVNIKNIPPGQTYHVKVSNSTTIQAETTVDGSNYPEKYIYFY